MHGTERPSSNLILDYVLIDVMLRLAIFFIIRILRPRIQCLLDRAVLRGRATVMSKGTLVGGGGALEISTTSPHHKLSTSLERTDVGL
jgi:hypothetical protein